jgi:hypothetical protein
VELCHAPPPLPARWQPRPASARPSVRSADPSPRLVRRNDQPGDDVNEAMRDAPPFRILRQNQSPIEISNRDQLIPPNAADCSTMCGLQYFAPLSVRCGSPLLSGHSPWEIDWQLLADCCRSRPAPSLRWGRPTCVELYCRFTMTRRSTDSILSLICFSYSPLNRKSGCVGTYRFHASIQSVAISRCACFSEISSLHTIL